MHIFHLATRIETKVIDLINMVNKITGNYNGVEFVARRDWDKITHLRASIEKTGKVLGYEPKIQIKDGVGKTFDWIKGNYDKIETNIKF